MMIKLILILVLFQVSNIYGIKTIHKLKRRTKSNTLQIQDSSLDGQHEFAEVTEYEIEKDDASRDTHQSKSTYIHVPRVIVPILNAQPSNYEVAIDITEAEKKRNLNFLRYNGTEYEKPAILPEVKDFGFLYEDKLSKALLEENNSTISKKFKEQKTAEKNIEKSDADQKGAQPMQITIQKLDSQPKSMNSESAATVYKVKDVLAEKN